jgi:hypothetical protein
MRGLWCVLWHRRWWSERALLRWCNRCGREFLDLAGMSDLLGPAQDRPVDLQTGPQKSPRGDHHE